MDSASASRTSATLLGRLRQDPRDQAAWAAFVARYGRKIYGWCRQWKLQEADAEDVTQSVLLILARKMSTFDYDPVLGFRGWLKTVTRHTLSDVVTERRKGAERGSGDSQTAMMLASLEARDDLVDRLHAEFDQELLDAAIVQVRLRVKPHTWEAFRLTAIEGQSGAAAAQQLGLQVATVFNAKSKVRKLLQEEIRKLEEADS